MYIQVLRASLDRGESFFRGGRLPWNAPGVSEKGKERERENDRRNRVRGTLAILTGMGLCRGGRSRGEASSAREGK